MTWYPPKPKGRPSKLKSKWFPEQQFLGRPRQLAGCTARDIVEVAFEIREDELRKKYRKREAGMEKRRKAAIAKVSLAKMPWDDE